MRLIFTVFGKPAQMGSKTAFVVKAKATGKHRAVLTDSNSEKRKQWANAVSTAAAQEMRGLPLMRGPVSLRVEFCFARPQSHFGTGRNAAALKDSAPERHAQSPDLDKLVRCLCDALTGIVFVDDRQIDTLTATRRWTSGPECATIDVLDPTPEPVPAEELDHIPF